MTFLSILQKGLRTLCVAYRRFTDLEYQEVEQRLFEAKTALQQREERVTEVFNFIERDLVILGATGVEDKYVLPVLISLETDNHESVLTVLCTA